MLVFSSSVSHFSSSISLSNCLLYWSVNLCPFFCCHKQFLCAFIGIMPFLFALETGDFFFLVVFVSFLFLCHGCEGNTIIRLTPVIVVFSYFSIWIVHDMLQRRFLEMGLSWVWLRFSCLQLISHTCTYWLLAWIGWRDVFQLLSFPHHLFVVEWDWLWAL